MARIDKYSEQRLQQMQKCQSRKNARRKARKRRNAALRAKYGGRLSPKPGSGLLVTA